MKATALFLTFVWYGHVLFAQNITVTGNVRSSTDSLPINGASILIKGTSKGTVSNADGGFSISTSIRMPFSSFHTWVSLSRKFRKTAGSKSKLSFSKANSRNLAKLW